MFIFPGTRQKAGGKSFPTGTIMLFKQTAAPLGWVKITTTNDAGLRVVSGTVSAVTANTAFSTIFGQSATGASTLSTAQLAAHTHGLPQGSNPCVNGSMGLTDGGGIVSNSASAGSGGSHTHTVSLQLNYVDVILASKK